MASRSPWAATVRARLAPIVSSRIGTSVGPASMASVMLAMLARAELPFDSCGIGPESKGSSGSSADQHAGVHDPVGVDGALGGAERVGEQLRALAVVLRAVHPADGVVVRDRAAGVGDRLAGGRLHLRPLRQLRA